MKKNKKRNIYDQIHDSTGAIIWWLVVLGIAALIYSSISNKVTDVLDDKNSANEECVEETLMVKNEFTAKKLYKACMKRKGY